MEELKYMALKKVLDIGIMNDHADIEVNIKKKKHIVEVSTIDNEKDFTVYTEEEYTEKYGNNK